MMELIAVLVLTIFSPRGLDGLLPGSRQTTPIAFEDRATDPDMMRGRQMLFLEVIDPNRIQQLDLVIRQEWQVQDEGRRPVIVARLVAGSGNMARVAYADSRYCSALHQVLEQVEAMELPSFAADPARPYAAGDTAIVPDGFALDDVSFALRGESGGPGYVQMLITGGLGSIVADWAREALTVLSPCWEAAKRPGLMR